MATKLAIVTGATGNMGQAVIKKFLSEGYKVIGTLVPNDQVKMEIKDRNFETIVVNLTDESESKIFIESAVKKYGTIDAAVLTVGGFAMGSISQTSSSDIQKQYRLNFETAYHVARPVFSQMMSQKKGRIFIIGS